MAKVGGWGGGPCFGCGEILTSVKSTMSHGVSPSLHNQSRNPAYSFADRRVSHAIFRCPPKSASFHTRFASFLSRCGEWGRSSAAVRPSSFSAHFARKEASGGSIGRDSGRRRCRRPDRLFLPSSMPGAGSLRPKAVKRRELSFSSSRGLDRGECVAISKTQRLLDFSAKAVCAACKKKGAPTCAGAPQRSRHCRICAQTVVLGATS